MPLHPLEHPLAAVRRLKAMLRPGERVILSFSCGKESLAAAELLHELGVRFVPYFMWVVEGLSFHEETIARTEARYGVKVIRLPHWNLGETYRLQPFTGGQIDPRTFPAVLKMTDVERHVRQTTGLSWLVYGHRANESLQRRAMISQFGRGLDAKRKRCYPMAYWTEKSVHAYLKRRGVRLSAEYAHMRRSYGGSFAPDELIIIRDHYPADYAKIVAAFPGLPAIVHAEECRRARGGKVMARRG